MASRAHHPVLPYLDAMETERPPPSLASELLEEIFLRVASPTDLARASAACISFRLLIRNPSFLRRYRSVHPPLLLGFFGADGFLPVEPTQPSAAVARAIARTADFSFNFFPSPSRHLCDVRDGRVLVERRNEQFMGTERRCFRDLAVCDPLSQRYLLLPPMTNDLLASVGLQSKDMYCSGASLIPSGGMEEETSFSVMHWMISKTRLVVFIFSTSSGHWAARASISWTDLGLYEQAYWLGPGRFVYGCFYWKVNKLIKLDMNTMELSTYDVPPDHDNKNIVIVESGEGKVGMLSPLYDGMSLEYYTLLQNGTEKSHKWHLKSTIPLPFYGTNFFITGQAEGYVFLTRIVNKLVTTIFFEVYSLDVKSCNFERACRTRAFCFAYPYFGFPPFMSPRRIQGYGDWRGLGSHQHWSGCSLLYQTISLLICFWLQWVNLMFDDRCYYKMLLP